MKIRVATPEDAPEITKFNLLMAAETEHRRLNPETLRNGVDRILSDKSKGLYYVADIRGELVGQLMITYEWSDWRNGTFWWIQSVYVRKDFRHKGVFKNMYEHVVSLARKDPSVCGIRLYVERHNEIARRTYEALGMVMTEYELFETDWQLNA